MVRDTGYVFTLTEDTATWKTKIKPFFSYSPYLYIDYNAFIVDEVIPEARRYMVEGEYRW